MKFSDKSGAAFSTHLGVSMSADIMILLETGVRIILIHLFN